MWDKLYYGNSLRDWGISLLIIVGALIVNKLITNFHQSRSTLLLLVSAFVGDDNRRKIYDFALGHNFRFLSYGDSSLLTNNSTQ